MSDMPAMSERDVSVTSLSDGVMPSPDARPRCSCHGDPMVRAGVGSGGKQRWRCRIERAEVNRRYAQTEKFKDCQSRYRATPAGTASSRRRASKYRRTDRGKAAQNRYLTSKKGEAQIRKRVDDARMKRISQRLPLNRERLKTLEREIARYEKEIRSRDGAK